jgi:hypothetical protein
MKKIVVVTSRIDEIQELINWLKELFPECEIWIISEEDAEEVSETLDSNAYKDQIQKEK